MIIAAAERLFPGVRPALFTDLRRHGFNLRQKLLFDHKRNARSAIALRRARCPLHISAIWPPVSRHCVRLFIRIPKMFSPNIAADVFVLL